MKIALKGFKSQSEAFPIDGILIHKGRCMSDIETRILINYGLEHNCECADDVPEKIINEICETHGNAEWMRKYDDSPQFISLPYLRKILKKIQYCYGGDIEDLDMDYLVDKVEEEM